MTNDPQRVQAIFLAAVEKPRDGRAAFLDEQYGGDDELRRRVEELLAAHEASGSFLEQPAGAPFQGTEGYTPPPGDAACPSTTADPVFRPGTVIAGRYTLMERIGEGGMGEVWVARQTEPVKRMVAVKFIKAGMDSKQVLTRFEAERQALALMDHPNIAKVLDGGLTDDRRPFFVMELVNGLPLNRFCDGAKLTPRDRLMLFVPVCQAVQHAHQKGIVHRDLKPSNILVTLYDGKPVPKVIDFGVAKATGGRLTDESVGTQFGAVVGTLEYMAPEQAGFSALDIDTRADIYSLGVILYELLTGLRPFDARRLRRAALDELIRIIREEEPSRPSARLSTDESLPSLAALRQTEPKRLMALMRGELDWIVMRCLEKSRERRYESAGGLARDVERYLADEPVEARPPSTGYRLRKFVSRHRGPVVAGLTIAGLLVAGVAVSTWLAVWASQAEGVAVEQRNKAQDANANLLEARDEMWQNLYAARCTLISNAWEARQYPLVRELLAAQVPKAGQRDLRGFEWHYLDRQLDADLLSVPLPQNSVTTVAFSPDGARALGVFRQENGFRLKSFDTTTGKDIFAVQLPQNWSPMVAFSPDGKRMVLELPEDEKVPPEKVSLRVYDAPTGAEVQTIRGIKPALTLATGPEGRLLVWGERDQAGKNQLNSPMRVRAWDTAAGKEVDSPIRLGKAGPSKIWAVSPDGKALAVSLHKGETVGALPVPGKLLPIMPFGSRVLDIKVLEVATGKELLTFQAENVDSVAFSPDGKRLLVAGQTVAVWDLADKRMILDIRENAIAAAFSPDGGRIAYLAGDGRGEAFDAKILEVGTGRVRRVVKGHDGRILAVAFSHDGARLITAGRDRIKHWDATADDRLAAQLAGVNRAASPDGRRLAILHLPAGGLQGMAGGPIIRPAPGQEGPDTTITVFGDGDKAIFKSPPLELKNIRFTFSPDGRRLALWGHDDVREGGQVHRKAGLRLWDVDAAREVLAVTGSDPFTDMVFSPDGRRIAATVESPRATVRVWDADTGREQYSLPVAAECQVAFSPDGTRLAVLGRDGEHSVALTVRDAAGGREIISASQSLPAGWRWDGSRYGAALALSPRGTRVAFTPSDNEGVSSPTAIVRVWNPGSEGSSVDLKGFKGRVSDLAFSPDGQRLATVSEDSTLRLWDPQTGAELLRITLPGTFGHKVSFSPDGRSLRVGLMNRGTAEEEVRVLDATPR